MKHTLLAAALLAVSGTAALHAQTELTGAGSTFAAPIYQKWAEAYEAKTHVKINYQSIGSGGGIAQLKDMTVDFGGTDAPMTDADIASAKGGAIVHIPTVAGAVTVAYNLPSVKTPLKLDGPTIADIYLNKITKWNDTRIAGLNPGVTLPNKDIAVVHRSDGSGTTFVFSDYLASVSPEWAKAPGKGKDLQWPTGMGGKGNEGVGGQVKQIEGAIGYVELAYANSNHLQTALIKNKDGKFVAPSTKGAAAAVAGLAASVPATSDFRIDIINAPGADTYPISSFTWMVIYTKQSNPAKGKALVDFVKWALQDGDSMAESLDYAPLPASMKTKVIARLGQIH